jgi:hypothetical protein
MTMDNHENQPMDRQPANETAMQQGVNTSRRRFTRLGLGASGVVMTLASRSVLAQSACKSPSGFLSNNASAHTDPAVCTGSDPAGWSASTSWPIDEKTTFVSVFGSTTAASWTKKINNKSFFDAELSTTTPWSPSSSNSGNNGQSAKANGIGSETDATMREVLNSDTTPQVVKYLIAAYLNAISGRNAFPTTQQVLEIYREWSSNGRYEVSAGIFWYDGDILQYLQSTMGPFVG